MQIKFYKYQGTGNDFIILDNRDGAYNALSDKSVQDLCHRHFGIGADGLMMLQGKEGYDFEMVYYNSDGQPGSMCGNGGRCLVQFARLMGLQKKEINFLASDGPHQARIDEEDIVSLNMKDVLEVKTHGEGIILDTGSPHYVAFVDDVAAIDVVAKGKEIRNSKPFAEKGINVNFVQILDEDEFFVRTYERGVEDETFSCGTGVTAAAIGSPHNHTGFNRVEIKTTGGKLSVEYDKINDQTFKNIWLAGPGTFVYQGEIQTQD